MASFAEYKIVFTVNIAVGETVKNLYLLEDAVYNAYRLDEYCHTSRLSPGFFAQGATMQDSIVNLRDAIRLDFIDNGNWPGVTVAIETTTLANDTLVFSCNDILTSFDPARPTFAPIILPAGATGQNTLPVNDSIQIQDVEILEALNNKTNLCRNKVIVVPGQSTPPYTIYYPGNFNYGLAADEIIIQVPRLEGDSTKPTPSIFELYDDNDNYVASRIGVLQSMVNNLRASFLSDEGYVTRGVLLEILGTMYSCVTYDQEIIISCVIKNASGDILVANAVIYEDRNGVYDFITYNLPIDEDIHFSFTDNFGGVLDDYIILSTPDVDVESKYMKSNSLDFIKENSDAYPNFTNQTYDELTFKNLMQKKYCQKFLKTSNLWIQFQAKTDDIKAYLYQDGVKTDITSSIEVIYTINGVIWHKITPVLTSLLGEYYIEVYFNEGAINEEVWISQRFQVQVSYERTALLQWRNDINQYGYQDGIYWEDDVYQEMIIDGELRAIDFSSDKTVLNDSNNRMINLKSYNAAIDMLTIYRIPYYIKEKVTLGLAHYKFLVNGIEYQMEEKPEINAYDGDTLYHGELALQRVNYEIY